MEVRITARHAKIGKKLKDYALEKLGPLSRYYDRTRELEVVFDGAPSGWKIEIIAHLQRGEPIVASVQNKDPMAAVDLAHDKLERLLGREKEKRRERRRDGRSPEPAGAPAAPSGKSKKQPVAREEE